jgi:hypothetical protein
VVWDDGEFVEDEVVGGVLGRELGDQKIWRWMLEGIGLWCFGAIVGFQIGGLLCEGRAVAKLVLGLRVRTVVVGVSASLTDIPAALMMDRWVEENTRWPVSLAAVKRLATSVGRDSENPNCIVEVEWS